MIARIVGIVGLCVLAFVHECVSMFFLPSRDASIPGLVPGRKLEQANGLMLAASYGSIPIAAALFGGLRVAPSHLPIPFWFRSHPTALAFVFDSATFLFSADARRLRRGCPGRSAPVGMPAEGSQRLHEDGPGRA